MMITTSYMWFMLIVSFWWVHALEPLLKLDGSVEDIYTLFDKQRPEIGMYIFPSTSILIDLL